MTQEEIISMAREAGVRDDENIFEFSQYKYLERFAKLVAEKEREEFAVHAIDIARRAIAEEREACAKVCENIETYEKIEKACFKFAAKTIRARGQQ